MAYLYWAQIKEEMIDKSNASMTTPARPSMPSFPSEVNLLDKLDGFTDMAYLNKMEADWSYNFTKFLLKEAQNSMVFRADFTLHAQFSRYYFAQQAALQQQGRGSFALGFPMLLLEQEKEVVLTPLIIWELSLEPHPTKAQSWQIFQHPHQKQFFNRQLKRLLTTEQWEKCWPIVEKLERKGGDSPGDLVDFCSLFAENAGLDLREKAITLSDIPDLADVGVENRNGLIHWSGLFGIHPLSDYWFEHLEKTQAKNSTAAELTKYWPVGVNVLDPWQAQAFKGILTKDEVQISGKEGSGKTYLLRHFLSNLLFNNRKTLIVSSQMENLALLHTALEETGLARFSFLIPKAANAMSKLQQHLIVLNNNSSKTNKRSTDKTIETELAEWQKEKSKLDQLFEGSRGKTFGHFNRLDTIAFLLRSSRTEGKELLASQLDPKDFSFTPPEMERLAVAIEQSEPLFDQIRTLSHPLNNLNAGIFLHNNKEEALAFIQQTSKRYLDKATQLQYDFILQLNTYRDQLLTWHDIAYQTLKQHLEDLQDKLRRYLKSFSRDTLESAKATLKLYGALSGRFQKALAAQEDIQLLYAGLEAKSQEYSFFAHPFLEGRERKKMKDLENNLHIFEESLNKWRSNLGTSIQEDVNRLNSKTVHTQILVKDQVLSLEAKFDIFIDEFNASGLYQLPLQSKTLTFPKRQRFLQDCIEQLEVTRLNLRDFNIFYDWQKHWFLLPALARRIVSALVKVRPKSWLAAFESWYFEQCLNQTHQPLTSLSEHGLAQFAYRDEKIRAKVLTEAKKRAGIQRQNGLKQLKGRGKIWQEWLKTQTPGFDQLLQICNQQLDVLTNIFPIVLTTPTEASILMENAGQSFDVVVAWENKGVSPDLKASLRKLGKKWVGFSNPEQQFLIPPPEAVYFLQNTYWQSPLDPSAVVIDGISDLKVHCEWVNGRFDESLEKNEEEAQAILQRLNKVETLADGRYPSVGIVCLTEGQRNLFLEYIQQIKQQDLPGIERIKQLETSGLRVWSLAELSGQLYDVVMVSATYGKLGVKGKLSAKVQLLNQPATIAGLQQIKNIAGEQLEIFHSIPEKDWNKWLEVPSLKGQEVLATYIQRAILLSEGKGIPLAAPEKNEEENTSFSQEVAWRIAPHISTNRLRLDQNFKGMDLPLTILPSESKRTTTKLFLIDGFLSQTEATDYSWEFTQQQTLAENGYTFQSLSSYKWWKNPDGETEELLQFIQSWDQSPLLEEE